MNQKKIISTLLTFAMMVGCISMTACTKTADTADETEASEVTEAAVEETTEAASETSEAAEETTAAAVSLTADETSANAFASFTAKIEEIHAADSANTAKYAYVDYAFTDADEVDSSWGLFVSTDGSEQGTLYGIKDGAVTAMDEAHYCTTAISYEDIILLPIMIDCNGLSAIDCIDSSEIANGTYFGSIYAVSADGSSVLIAYGDPIIVDSETAANAATSSTITDINGNTYSVQTEDGCVLLTDSEGTVNYGNFVELEDGTFRLTSESDCVEYHNVKVAAVSVSSDCSISDKFQMLYNMENNISDSTDDYTLLFDPEGPNSLTNTYFFQTVIGNEFHSYYNNYITASGMLEPVTIENGQITSLTLGWR